MADHVRYSYPDFLNRSKKTSYRQAVTARGKSLMKFLLENNLVLINPFKDDGEIKDDLVIRLSNLTQEGAEILNEPVAKWWSFVEKGGDVNDISILEKSLSKIRKDSKGK
jgi:hypothetical protein